MSTELNHLASELQLVDHHVHAPLSKSVDRVELEQLLTESDRPAPAGTTVFDSQVGIAIRRHCSPLLGVEPGVTAEEYFHARSQFSPDELARIFLEKAGVNHWIVDTGFGGDAIWPLERMAQTVEGTCHEIVRLESVLEEVSPGSSAENLQEKFATEIERRSVQAVGWKSVIAYRHGFDIAPQRPSDTEVRTAADRWLRAVDAEKSPRVTDPVLLRMLMYIACDTGKPLQLHVGFGDPDIDLHRCNPALLTDWLRLIEGSGSNIMLLHCYPYHREAGYLAHSFPHVYLDVGLAINYSGAAATQIVAESMELAPFTKVLYSSDAWGPPELHYLGALLWRRATARTAARWIDEGEWSLADARRVMELVGYENALRVYGVSS